MEVRGQKTNICGNRNDRQVEFHIVEKLWVITPWQTKQIKKKKKKEKKKEKKSQSTAREHLLLQRFNSRTNIVMLIRTIANDGSTTDYYFI